MDVGVLGWALYHVLVSPLGPMKFHGPLDELLTANWNSVSALVGSVPSQVKLFNCAPVETPVSNGVESRYPLVAPAVHVVSTSYDVSPMYTTPHVLVLSQLKLIHPNVSFHAYP